MAKAVGAAVDTNSVAKLFEEIKVMFRDLPDRLQGQIHESLGSRNRRRRRFHPGYLMDMFRQADSAGGDPALGWLMIISQFKDEAPWLYEVGLEIYHALQERDGIRVEKAIDRLDRLLSTVRRGPFAEMIIDSAEMDSFLHELPRMAHHIFVASMGPSRPRLSRKSKPQPELPKP